jgi:sodium-dependent dicarboxylate transporter 2/3/5
LDTILLVAIAVTIVLILTEIMSNVALISIFLPVLAGMAFGVGENPLLLMIPSALAASCAFTMPISTPPNAIVFSSGHVRTIEMAKVGIVLNVFGIAVITLLSHTIILHVFDIQLSDLPEWALKFKP